MKYRYQAHVTQNREAHELYLRFKKALGLAEWEPPSDAQRMAFDVIFCGNYDREKFWVLCSNGASMAECLKGASLYADDGI